MKKIKFLFLGIFLMAGFMVEAAAAFAYVEFDESCGPEVTLGGGKVRWYALG